MSVADSLQEVSEGRPREKEEEWRENIKVVYGLAGIYEKGQFSTFECVTTESSDSLGGIVQVVTLRECHKHQRTVV